MAEPKPVLVIHGVGCRNSSEFKERVDELNKLVGDAWKFIPVFWGDLGAEVKGIEDTIPHVPTDRVRGIISQPVMPLAMNLLKQYTPPQGRGVRASSLLVEKIEIVSRAAIMASGLPVPSKVRGEKASKTLRDTIKERLGETRCLKLIEDKALLEAIGQTLGVALQSASPKRLGQAETRGFVADVKGVVNRMFFELDAFVEAMIVQVLANFNQFLRVQYGPDIVHFLGDIFVYQRHRAEIHSRLREAISQSAREFGTCENPIHVIAHSLGGLIAFDAAVDTQMPLYINGFVTFGSQPAFFHVVDPRTSLSKYQRRPVKLPPTILKWTNLWDSLDPLAFLAGKIFHLSSSECPKDIEVAHMPSSGLWTHSTYWKHHTLVETIRTSLA